MVIGALLTLTAVPRAPTWAAISGSGYFLQNLDLLEEEGTNKQALSDFHSLESVDAFCEAAAIT